MPCSRSPKFQVIRDNQARRSSLFWRPQLRIEKKNSAIPIPLAHFVYANSSRIEEKANPITQSTVQEVGNRKEKRTSPNYKFLGDEPRSWQPICFMTRVIGSESLERDRYVQKREKSAQAKHPNPWNTRQDVHPVYAIRFERQMKSVNSLMQRPEVKKCKEMVVRSRQPPLW